MKILMATHPNLIPAKGRKGSESDIYRALLKLGHQVDCVGFEHTGQEFDRALEQFKPELVFNLLEEFAAEAVYDFHLVTRLESLNIPFTGCNPRGLAISRNKSTSLRIARAAGLRTPDSWLLRGRKLPAGLNYPVFAKFNREHSSMGIRESNRCTNAAGLKLVLRRLERDYGLEVLLQEFIAGHEVSLSLCGNSSVAVFAPRQLQMSGTTQIATERLKFNLKFQKSRKIRRGEELGMPKILLERCRELYRDLDLSGYARFDFRKRKDGEFYLIDVNANPNLAKDEDFALSAKRAGYSYEELIERLVKLGRSYAPVR